MKNQALFSSKDISKKLKCPLLQFLFGTLRVNKKESSNHNVVLGRRRNEFKLTCTSVSNLKVS